MEKQFVRYYKEAAKRPGKTGETLLQILESRLDNVIYRAGLARTRRARVSSCTHGHFEVNGAASTSRPTASSSTTSSRSASSPSRRFPIELARQTFGDRPIPAWMQVVDGSLQILIHQLPVRAQIDSQLTEQLIVELYSKN